MSYQCSVCGDGFCPGCDEAEDPDWVAADREYGRRIHRTNRLMMAIDLAEKLFDQLPEGSKEAAMMWERSQNLYRVLVDHRRMGFAKNKQRQAQQPRQTLRGN